MTKAPTPTESSIKQSYNTKSPLKYFDYTSSLDLLRTVSLSDDSNPTGVVKELYGSFRKDR